MTLRIMMRVDIELSLCWSSADPRPLPAIRRHIPNTCSIPTRLEVHCVLLRYLFESLLHLPILTSIS
jgi:hypothetical protein